MGKAGQVCRVDTFDVFNPMARVAFAVDFLKLFVGIESDARCTAWMYLSGGIAVGAVELMPSE